MRRRVAWRILILNMPQHKTSYPTHKSDIYLCVFFFRVRGMDDKTAEGNCVHREIFKKF